MKKFILSLLVFAANLMLGYPAVFLMLHGLDPRSWPALLSSPVDWLGRLKSLPSNVVGFLVYAQNTYLDMLTDQLPTLSGMGRLGLLTIFATGAIFVVLLTTRQQFVPGRHFSNRYGDAAFATSRDLGRMRRGLELGLDPKSGRAVRAQVQGNLLTIAPPRTGKTTGAILPNLLFPSENAWAGPAIVVDPKGDVVRTVRARRQQIGQTVRVIDPLKLVGESDRWNPLEGLAVDDVLELQSAARALLPDVDQTSESGSFFRDRAVTIVAAALQNAVRDGGSIGDAAALVRSSEKLAAALEGRSDALSEDARNILTVMPEKTRGDVLSTAAQAFTWLLDPRMQAVVADPTFSLTELCDGTTDLYIVIPADRRRKEMASYVRWLLEALFSTIRGRRPVERIMVIIDEAFVLGSFDALIRGAGELPGYGVSLWTFWQSESQMVEIYGETGKDILINTAEVLMLFNLSSAQGAEREKWSTALGTFTGIQETTSIDPVSGRETKSTTAVAEALVPASELAALTRDHTLVFMNSRAYPTRPLKLKKTLAHDDPRFTGLGNQAQPVGPTG